jgi:KEOPS complex subunit Cgi121
LNAIVAFRNKTNTTRSLAVETILFASAQRQISKAFEMMGLKSESERITVLIIDETKKGAITKLNSITKVISGDIDNDALIMNNKKFDEIKNLFDITDLELNSKLEKKNLKSEILIDLVIEHVALLAIRR